MSTMELTEYYKALGLPDEAWHLGPEHPELERLALRVLGGSARARILEIGVQSGGFAVPVILDSAGRPGFSYTGVDALKYTNAVPLGLIADYLDQRRITGPIRFVEGDSTQALSAMTADSFDLILLDHYKAKYALDLHIVCARELLNAEGTIIVHDVLAHAARAWSICERVCRAFGYTWTIESGVPNGAAIVRRGHGARRRPMLAYLVGAEVAVRWQAHAAVSDGRRGAGRLLRAVGLRS
jgi:hypothetical protein